MSIEKMREEFEASYMKDVAERFLGAEVDDDEWVARNNNGEYRSYRAAGAWWAWVASREDIVIELPAIRAEDYCPLSNVSYREECRESIHAAGVKTK